MRKKYSESSEMAIRKRQSQPGKAPAKAVFALGGAWTQSDLIAAIVIGQISFIGAPRRCHDRRSVRGSGVPR
jgi:hypothetical protein